MATGWIWVKIEIGASEGIRTLDIHLGKVTLYQAELRSLPCKAVKSYENPARMQALFCRLTHAGPRTYAPGLILETASKPACLPRKEVRKIDRN